MRHLLSALALGTIFATAGIAHADKPTQIKDEVNFSFPSGFWTRTCGLPVVQTIAGKTQIKLFTAADGSVRELDTFPGMTIVLSAPSTGGSFSQVLGPATFEYPEGVFIGAPSVVTTNGMHRRAPGLPAEAGQTVFEGVVIVILNGGVPVVDFGPPAIEEHGNVNDLLEMIDAACAALGG